MKNRTKKIINLSIFIVLIGISGYLIRNSFLQEKKGQNLSPNYTQKLLPPEVDTSQLTTFSVDRYVHSFGEIEQQSTNETTFSITNTGKNPLIITQALGSCGCTVPEFPKEPVKPGNKAEIRVVYKPGSQTGNQKKSIRIFANTKPVTTLVEVTATVKPLE